MDSGLEKIIQIKGNVRGAILQSHATFIQNKKGVEGLRAVEEKMAELGYPINLKQIKPGEWYPEALSVLVILTAKDLFGWTEKDIFEMGSLAPKHTFISRILMRYFISMERFMLEVPKHWKKHVDIGELEVVQFDEEKKYIILREKDFKFHPILCIYHAGYYRGITDFIIKSQKISIEEVRCVFKGDPYNEYVIKWE